MCLTVFKRCKHYVALQHYKLVFAAFNSVERNFLISAEIELVARARYGYACGYNIEVAGFVCKFIVCVG